MGRPLSGMLQCPPFVIEIEPIYCRDFSECRSTAAHDEST